MRFTILSLFALLLCSQPSYSQGYALEEEVVNENIGVLIGALGPVDLSGYSCTRLYVTMANADDFMSSVSGDAVNPTYVNTTTDFYNAALGAATPNGINSILFPVYPDLPFDSWVTIGLEGVPNAAAGEAAVATVQSTDNPWSTNFEPGFGAAGSNIAIDDPIGGAWYALNGDANGVAGDDLKVLVGQFTTTGDLSGQLYCQVFINGNGAQEYRETFYIGAPPAVPGCTDETACNYSMEATEDDGSCTYADPGLNCDGSCIDDTDGDGICDGDEVPGCTDETACNYSADATDDDASCTYADPGLNCDGSCIDDADGDGICDGDEIPGCTDETACNYSADATDDDASCTYADPGLNCDGSCIDDADGDGICDGDEVPGCTDETACNYSADATDDDASCTYADPGLNCDGSCIDDADADGICDGDEVPGCTDGSATNYAATATDDDGSCEYACAPEWGMPIIFPSVATVLAQITVDGENAAADDLVGAFINGELRGEGDIIEFDGGTYVSMTVYLAGGDETISFTLFNGAECSTCEMDGELTPMGFGEYGSYDDPLMLDANCSANTLEVDLTPGWNYVSTNVTPEDYSVASMFESPLEDNLLKVLGDNNFALGQSYTPGIPSVFNSLQMHTDAAGYVIKVESAATWTSTGTPLDVSNTPLDLNEGWNIIGYVPQNAMAVEEALASVDGLVGTVIDGQNGTVWNPANPNEFNSLLDLEPGRSYWIRMIEAGTLVYPGANNDNGDGSGMVMAHVRTDDNAASVMTGWQVVRAPGAAALAAEVLLDGATVSGEAYLGAFVDEVCVAARPLMEVNGFSAAQMALMLEGPGTVSFKLWLDGEVYASADEMSCEPGQEWGQGGTTMPIIGFSSSANGVASTEWVQAFSIAPVPAQGEAWINLHLHQGGQVLIQVLDARGATVATIHDGQWPAGAQRMPINVGRWAAGTYFIKGVGEQGTFSAPLIVK